MARYAEENSEEVVFDENRFANTDIKVIKKNIVGLADNRYIRHNPDALAEAIIDIASSIYRENVSDEVELLYTPERKRRSR